MKKAKLSLHPDFTIGEASGSLFGDFEQTSPEGSRYYDPESPLSDEQGFRKDIIEVLKSFGLGVIRFPGGSNMCLYRWKDGIGPKEDRIAREYYAGRRTDRMMVGIDEMFDYCGKVGCKVMLDLRAGFASGALDDLYDELEYVFSEGSGYWPSLRRKYGHDKPWKVDYICIGNEEDGDWEFCQHTPESYAHFAREAAKLIRHFSPETKIIVCGTSNPAVATYPEWDRSLLEAAYDYADYLSIHYIRMCNPDMQMGVKEPPVGIEDLPYLAAEFSGFIETEEAVIRYEQTRHHSDRRLGISIEEWFFPGIPDHIPDKPDFREVTELSEEDYRAVGAAMGSAAGGKFYRVHSFLEALLYGQCCLVMLNHADSVRISCGGFGFSLRSGVSGILKESDFYVAEMLSAHARGTVLRPALDSPTVKTLRYGEQPSVSAAAVLNGNTLAVYALNMDYDEDCELELDLGSFDGIKMTGRTEFYDDQLLCGNTFSNPFRVVPHKLPAEEVFRRVVLKKHSFNLLLFKTGQTEEE